MAPVRLFDELIRIGEGDAASYKKARDMAWKWMLDNPLNKMSAAWDKWSGYYEDVPKDTVNVNDMTSMMTAYYILVPGGSCERRSGLESSRGPSARPQPSASGTRSVLWRLGD